MTSGERELRLRKEEEEEEEEEEETRRVEFAVCRRASIVKRLVVGELL